MTRPKIELSPSQQAIIDAPSRIRLVRAGPGSGKTRVFVAELQRRLAIWSERRAGIAAISFTNVAQQEIADRLGGHPSAPHFIGTLDSFMWRFLVRPFAHTIGLAASGVCLIPGPVASHLDKPDVKVGPNDGDRESVFRIDLVGGTERDVVLGRRHPLTRKPIEIVAPYRDWALSEKAKQWKNRGRLTHSDVRYIASALLHSKHGEKIAALLTRRFPVILVDELQDTGWFFGRALVRLLKTPQLASLLVGDPDQGIYGFGGADRGLFDAISTLEGASELPLRESHRCTRRIAAVATALARSNHAVTTTADAPDGRTILLTHASPSVSLPAAVRNAIEREIAADECANVAILVRRNDWARLLGGGTAHVECPLASGIGRRLQRAVDLLIDGDAHAAARVVGRELGHLLLDDQTPTSERLRAAGVTSRQWRRACFALLAEAAAYPQGEAWGTWLERMKARTESVIAELGEVERRKIGATFRRSTEGAAIQRRRTVPAAALSEGAWTIDNVHRVKGREFDAVVYFSPKPHDARARCPSKEWWDANPTSEEREVAFVMVSRAKRLLILCVHEETGELLRRNRSAFFNLFDVR